MVVFSRYQLFYFGLILLFSLLPFSDYLSNLIAILLIAFVGIPHGAIDHIVYNIHSKNEYSTKATFSFLKTYLVRVIVFTFLWFVAPSATFILFIVLSAYHFGQTQYQHLQANSSTWLSTIWGLLLFVLLFSFHLPELSSLTVDFALVNFLMNSYLQQVYWLFGYCLFVVWSFLFYKFTPSNKLQFWFIEALELVLLIFLFSQVGLLLGFSVYFAFSHSWKALHQEYLLLKEISEDYSWSKLIRQVTPFTLLALIGMAIGYFIFTQLNLNVSPLLVLLILISAISFPHIILFNEFYKKQEKSFTNQKPEPLL